MSSIWRIPPAALFLFLLMLCGGFGLGALVGDWILPFVVALAHGGWSEVRRTPISERVFAEAPAFMDRQSTSYMFVNIGRIVLSFAGMVVFVLGGKRWWEYLVIDKYRWMTREEVEAFYKRDPGI